MNGLRPEKALPPAVESTLRRTLPWAARVRHQIHQAPEIAFQEFGTARLVRRHLKSMGWRLHKPYLETDVVADLGGPIGRAIVAWRTELDGLPMEDRGTIPWNSRNPGAMHGCGHDGHMAIALGAAQILAKHRNLLPHPVRLIFQPAEEVQCGGEPLSKSGALDGVSRIYALHGWPGLPLGTVSCRTGTLFAAGYFFAFTFHGKGTHGATPEKGRNPLPAAGRFLAACESTHRKWQRQSKAVLSVCRIQGGTADNVIPPAVTVQGTFRCLDGGEGPRRELELGNLARGIAERAGLTLSARWNRGYRYPVVNDEKEVLAVKGASDRYREAPAPTLASEDFAHMLRRKPGAMAWLGLGKNCPPLHAPRFDFPDGALEPGIRLAVKLLLKE